MTTFAMLTKLSPTTAHTPESLQALERDVAKRIEQQCPSLRWLANYVVLGNQSYLDVFEAPDIATALKASLVVDNYGPAETEIWPLLEWEQFKRALPRAREVAAKPVRHVMNGNLLNDVIDYLRHAGAAFRLTSYPVPEPKPAIAHGLRPGGKIVQTRVVQIDGRPALVCAPEGLQIDLASLGAALGATVLEGGPRNLPGAYSDAPEPLPPLGHLLRVPLVIDQSLTTATSIAFRAFGSGSYIELAYEDFARIEQPKVISFAIAGELAAMPKTPRVRPQRVTHAHAPKRRMPHRRA